MSNRSQTLRETSDQVRREMEADPHYQRLAAADELEDPDAAFRAQLGAICDQFVAQAIRNERSGKGQGLRASGLREVADLLGL